ncbi:hypothetical protein QFC21_004266 [Naganishia friedmannii]|uniref:Uncharacterized protein n=1 Tax=Naganishia friedmannii TaxID=89922 RepID=A0ACC2VGU7_9TREE|nr:hypothetical protein QFC21_004266 [Naganishia friedmannii]
MAAMFSAGDDSPIQTSQPSEIPRDAEYVFSIGGLDFEYSQEIDTALFQAREMLSPILAKMCPLVTKKGRKPLPATDWVRNSTKNRTHMAAIGSLALQSELIQLAEEDRCTELQRVYLMSCFGNAKLLGELVKLIIFGIPSATCNEPVESYARLITLLVGMTLGHLSLTIDDNHTTAHATQNKQKSKKGIKSKQNKAGKQHKEHSGSAQVRSSEQNRGQEVNGEQVQNPLPIAQGGGDSTLLAYFVARAAYITWTSEFLPHAMLSSRLSAILSLRHPVQEGEPANKLVQSMSFSETLAERMARETVMREVTERKDKEFVRGSLYGPSSSYDTSSADSSDVKEETSATAMQLRCELEEFLNFDVSPTKPNAFRDLMNVFIGRADEPESFGCTPLEKLICMECFRHLSLDSQEARVLNYLQYVDTPLEVPVHMVSPRDSRPDILQSQMAEPDDSGKRGVRLLSEGAVVRVYGDCASKAAKFRMWNELHKCFLETYMTKIALRGLSSGPAANASTDWTFPPVLKLIMRSHKPSGKNSSKQSKLSLIGFPASERASDE